MFKNPRYTTKGINDNLPIMTQIFLWGTHRDDGSARAGLLAGIHALG